MIPQSITRIVCPPRFQSAQSLVRTFILAVFVALALAATAPAAEVVRVRNLQELRAAVESRQRTLCDVELEVVVCASDSARGLLAVQDATGAEVCALNLSGREYHPGDRLRIAAPRCELIRRRWSVAFATPPVVDNGGVHATTETSGRIALTAGFHPIRLHYFNVANPARLEVSYAGPGRPRQRIPSQVLFLDAPATGTRTNGLRFSCYDDEPATLDKVRNQPPIHTGVATNFDISLRQPETDVAMLFHGFIEISQPGEYTFTVRSDDGAELYIGELEPDITRLGTTTPPAAISTSRPLPSLSEPGEWRTVEGIVSFAGKSRDGFELVLKENNRATRLWSASDAGLPPGLLLNGRVRATGVYRSVQGLDGESHAGRMAIVGDSNLQLLEVASGLWKKTPRTSITNALRLVGTEGVVNRVRGTVRGLRPNGEFQLNDDAAEIPVQALNGDGLTNGLAVEVLGAVIQTATGPGMDAASWRPQASLPAEMPVLTTAAQVQQLSSREAALQHPVVVRGVITCLVEWGGAVVQDATRGVFFSFEPSYRDGLEPGDYAEIQGVTAVGDFAPIISAKSIRVLGPGQMPEPVRPSWNQLISGSLDSQYAEVRGVVTEVSGNRITLLTESGKVRVLLHNTGEAALRRLLNTLVRIRGCLLAEWDSQTRQVRVGEIRFRNPIIEIDQLPMVDPFAAPEKMISDLLLFDLNASGFERVKITGQIVHVRSGEHFLMQDGKGLRFRLATDTVLKPGDVVEVVGIPELSGPSPRLHETVARKIGSAPLTPPVSWAVVEQAAKSPDAIRVETEVRLIGLHRAGSDWVLELQAGLRTFQARLDAGDNLESQFPLGSLLHVEGVYATMDDERNGDLAGFELLLNSADDIRLLERPPWWTLRRLFYIVASLVAVLAVAAIWISQLRRQVALRTEQLEREHERRERAEREHAVEMERSRIARDLHDDLGSSLTEIRVLASTGLRQPGTDARTPTLFQSITEKARSLVSALDVIVWAVDPEANSLQSLADYLSSYAEDYLTAANISCRFKIPVSLPSATLDGQVRHDVFLAVKETLHNVIRHSGATEVEFQLDATADSIRIVVADDGQGFDPADATRDGHGLKNIPGRLAAMGGQCRVESQPGAGTRVSIQIPIPRHGAGTIPERAGRG